MAGMMEGVIEGEIVHYLRKVLGLRLVAYITAASSTRRVKQWIDGSRPVGIVTAQQLLLTYHAAKTIEAGNKSRKDIQLWFQGQNPRLDDMAPARVIRDSDPQEVGLRILHAARSFAHFG